jgi:hypothetical protein
MTIGHMPPPKTGFSSIRHGRVVRYIFYRNSTEVTKARETLKARGLRVADWGPNWVSYYGTPSKREKVMLSKHQDVVQYNPKFKAIANAAFRKKFERCVMHVKSSGSGANPWAVCTTTLHGYPKRNPQESIPMEDWYGRPGTQGAGEEPRSLAGMAESQRHHYVDDAPEAVRRKPLSLHAKVTLIGFGALGLGGVIGYMAGSSVKTCPSS